MSEIITILQLSQYFLSLDPISCEWFGDVPALPEAVIQRVSVLRFP